MRLLTGLLFAMTIILGTNQVLGSVESRIDEIVSYTDVSNDEAVQYLINLSNKLKYNDKNQTFHSPTDLKTVITITPINKGSIESSDGLELQQITLTFEFHNFPNKIRYTITKNMRYEGANEEQGNTSKNETKNGYINNKQIDLLAPPILHINEEKQNQGLIEFKYESS